MLRSEDDPHKKFDVVTIGADWDTPVLLDKLQSLGGFSDHYPINGGYVFTNNVANQAKCLLRYNPRDNRQRGFLANNGMIREQEPQVVDFLNDDGDCQKKSITSYPSTETKEQYHLRMKKYFPWLAETARSNNNKLIFVQSITPSAIEHAHIEALFKSKGFTIACIPTENENLNDENTLLQLYHLKRDSYLLMAYDLAKIQFKGFYELKDLISSDHYDQQRFQACVFLDLETNAEFVAVNVCQDYGLVGKFISDDIKIKSGAVNDIQRLLTHFKNSNIPCIIAGDFNGMPEQTTSENSSVSITVDFNAEQGKIIQGLNHNISWYVQKQIPTAGNCDVVVYNETFRTILLNEKLAGVEKNISGDSSMHKVGIFSMKDKRITQTHQPSKAQRCMMM